MSKKTEGLNYLIEKILMGITDVKGQDIEMIDLRKIENRICDFYIICSGSSNTHVSAILDSVKKKVSKTLKEKPSHTEGEENAEWILLDYINVVVHIFQKQVRDFYRIEELWGDCKTNMIPIKNN
ncbi:MAG: ribosome silencing factor [Flavobacteriaceae bacterium TMED68]|nr:MAG: ribosome silencing factor [Flavobacteriaceae bacterium TMED68]|tara:strand:- start:3747 stop:4121 length:375 start_codon:yes stop_codon:yes gene_type:complete